MPEAHEEQAAHDDAGHMPVLAEQVLGQLDPKPGQVVLDCTAGRGGHGALLIPKLGPGGRYVGLDTDPANADYSRHRLSPIAKQAGVGLDVVHANFRDARGVLRQLGIEGVDGLLADLGFASNQMDDPARGMAFSEDGPLDMRLDTGATVTAEQLINQLPQDELADLIYEFGEERLSRRIARKIVELRTHEPITTTGALARLVRRAYGPRKSSSRRQRIDPATRTFMALRIAVNDEMGALDQLLTDLPGLLNPGGLNPGGRAAVISFHSLEDRRVKRAFLGLGKDAGFKVLTRKPVTANDDEARANPRSRSAKLRAIERSG